MDQKAFGRRLRQVRGVFKINEADAATACGVTLAMHRRYESGAAAMRCMRFMRFVRFVSAPEDIEWAFAWLLEGKGRQARLERRATTKNNENQSVCD